MWLPWRHRPLPPPEPLALCVGGSRDGSLVPLRATTLHVREIIADTVELDSVYQAMHFIITEDDGRKSIFHLWLLDGDTTDPREALAAIVSASHSERAAVTCSTTCPLVSCS